MTTDRPADWKNYDDFAAGIATNRLPRTDVLVGRTLSLHFAGFDLTLRPLSPDRLAWSSTGSRRGEGQDRYEAIEVAPDVHFIDLFFADRPDEGLTLLVDHARCRVLGILSRIRSTEEAGSEPRVAQDFLPGTLGNDPLRIAGSEPAESRDLIGLRTFQTYSPNHTYEHTYLSSQRYAWQCLVGVQRGHGDVDLASIWKFGDEQYVFTFREFRIPVASVFFFNFHDLRSTGKFLGLTADGSVSHSPAGAHITLASRTFYPPGIAPV